MGRERLTSGENVLYWRTGDRKRPPGPGAKGTVRDAASEPANRDRTEGRLPGGRGKSPPAAPIMCGRYRLCGMQL